LRQELNNKDWDKLLTKGQKTSRRQRFSKKNDVSLQQTSGNAIEEHASGSVDVVGLGFVTRMAEYMVAADVLVSKAGPGTIAEAASLGLPVMLTRYVCVISNYKIQRCFRNLQFCEIMLPILLIFL